jgi:hypothetical protein
LFTVFGLINIGYTIVTISFILLVCISKKFYTYSQMYGFKDTPFAKAIIAKQVYERFLNQNDLNALKQLSGKELLEKGIVKNSKVVLSAEDLEKRGYVKGFTKVLKEKLLEKF